MWTSTTARRQRLATVGRACALLRVFEGRDESLTLSEIADLTGYEMTAVFRIVHTLEEAGFVCKVAPRRYASNIRFKTGKKYRIGYAAQSEKSSFSIAVSEGLRRAAEAQEVDLIAFDNRYSASTAVANARRLIEERVDLAIEFQTYERAAPMISSLFAQAGIPAIAVEIPHPGATFFGIDNYRVGITAGRVLAHWAKQNWQGAPAEVLLLGIEIAGAPVHLRLEAIETALRESLGAIPFVHMDCKGEFDRAIEIVRKRLRAIPERRTLIAGANDPAVLGALAAFYEAARSRSCIAVGLGATPDARTEMRREGSRLIGSIAFFPELYGQGLMQLAHDILTRRHVPPAVYAHHQLITAATVDRYYPYDRVDT